MSVTQESTAWRLQSACKNVDPDIFYPPDDERDGVNRTRREQRAKAWCFECPVSGNCLDWALKHNEQGVWGGTTERERAAVKRRGPRARCVRCGSPNKAATDGGQVCLYCGLSWLV